MIQHSTLPCFIYRSPLYSSTRHQTNTPGNHASNRTKTTSGNYGPNDLLQSREYRCISFPFLPFICLTSAPSTYTPRTPRKSNTPSTKIQFKSAAILPISTTPLPSPIATNTTGTSRPMLVSQLLKGSGPSLDAKTRNFSATTAI